MNEMNIIDKQKKNYLLRDLFSFLGGRPRLPLLIALEQLLF